MHTTPSQQPSILLRAKPMNFLNASIELQLPGEDYELDLYLDLWYLKDFLEIFCPRHFRSVVCSKI